MSIIKEFKAFAMRGNVVDMAVGIILGVAFGKIVSSLVSDVLLPPIGLLMGGVDFSHFALTLKQATAESAAVTLKYGVFINTVIDFIIVASSVFLLIKGMNKLKKAQLPPAPEAPKLSKEAELLTEIKELLQKS